MKSFSLTIDDNIRFLKEIMEAGYSSLFDHPYTAMLKRLHEEFDLKIQLNMFYLTDGFDLSQMSDRYKAEWAACSDWLKMSFHARAAIQRLYAHSGYDEVFCDCREVNEQILRISSPASLAKTTTIHFCATNDEGVKALHDNGVCGLLGLFGSDERPRVSYDVAEEIAKQLRRGEILTDREVAFADIDLVANAVDEEEIVPILQKRLSHDTVRVMIHEQYFYKDFDRYQPNFEEKLRLASKTLCENGFVSRFFEEMIEGKHLFAKEMTI